MPRFITISVFCTVALAASLAPGRAWSEPSCIHPDGELPFGVLGDITDSGTVNAADALCSMMSLLVAQAGGPGASAGHACARVDPRLLDVDCDGELTLLDVQLTILLSRGPLPPGHASSPGGCPSACDGGEPPPPCPGASATISGPGDAYAWSGCTTLQNLSLHQASGVGEVHLPLLQAVTGHVYLHQNQGTTQVRLPALTSIGAYLYFHQNAGLATVELGSLQSVGEYVYFHENLDLTSVDLGSLETVGGYLYFHGNTSLTTLTLDSLQSVGEYTHISPPVP